MMKKKKSTDIGELLTLFTVNDRLINEYQDLMIKVGADDKERWRKYQVKVIELTQQRLKLLESLQENYNLEITKIYE